jgi:hypothetical protein
MAAIANVAAVTNPGVKRARMDTMVSVIVVGSATPMARHVPKSASI